jgi:hypothetical protein
MHEQIQGRLNTEDACYQHFSSGLLPTNMTIKILKLLTLYLALYGHETRSSTLRDRLRVLESRVFRRYLGLRRWQ